MFDNMLAMSSCLAWPRSNGGFAGGGWIRGGEFVIIPIADDSSSPTDRSKLEKDCGGGGVEHRRGEVLFAGGGGGSDISNPGGGGAEETAVSNCCWSC